MYVAVPIYLVSAVLVFSPVVISLPHEMMDITGNPWLRYFLLTDCDDWSMLFNSFTEQLLPTIPLIVYVVKNINDRQFIDSPLILASKCSKNSRLMKSNLKNCGSCFGLNSQ